MRRPSSIWLVAFGLLAATHGWAQQPVNGSLPDRGPRFLLAAAAGHDRMPVDVQRTPSLRRRISVQFEGATLGEALDEISRRANLRLFYSRHTVPLDSPIYLRAENITVAGALSEVLLDAGVDVLMSPDGRAALVRRGAPDAAQTGIVSGRVTDAETGQGLGGTEVLLEGTRWRALTAEDGRYRLTEIAPGTYAIVARRIGYGRISREVTIAAEQESTADFALRPAPTQLEEVVTTGTVLPTEVKALPTPITVITGEEVAQRHPQSFVDIIRSAIPTSVAWDRSSQPIETNVSVRGVSSLSSTSPMKIFIDGIEAASSSIAAIDPYSIERVEAIRGPQASAIYGADAAGGVIQIFTKRGRQGLDRPEVSLRAELGLLQTPYAGSRTALRQHYAASLRGGTGDVSYNFGGGYTRLADYLPIDDRSRQSSPSFHGGVRYARGIIEVDVSGRYFRNNLPVVLSPLAVSTGFASVAIPQFSVQDWTNETYGARVKLRPTDWWRHEATVGIDRPTIQNVQTRPRFVTPDDSLLSVGYSDFRKVSVGYNTSLVGNLASDLAGSLTVGLDHYDNDERGFFANQAVRVDGTIETTPGGFSANRTSITNTGYFAQAQLGFREAAYLSLALRAEDNSAFGHDLATPVQPRVGLAVVRSLGATTLKVRAAYGRSIRAPNSGFAQGNVSATQINLANTLLAPERQRGWDGGVDLVFGALGSLSVTGYSQTADDLIGIVQLAVTPIPTFQFQNIGRATNRGVEIEGTFTALSSVVLKAQYGYVRSRIEDLGSLTEVNGLIVGDRPDGTPAHTAGATLTFAQERRGTTVTAGFSYVGSWRSISSVALFSCLGGTAACPESFLTTGSLREFITDYPAFTKFNATISQRITERIEGYLSVDNLTNNEAVEQTDFNPVMGRLTAIGVQVRY